MKKKIIIFILGVYAVFFSGNVFAAEIANLKATISSDGKDLFISWDAASSEVLFNSDGYAVQWGNRQKDVKIDNIGRKFLNSNDISFSIVTRGFNRGDYYYFRVYSYKKVGTSLSNSILGNGSKILRLRIDSNNEIETSYIEPNDPVIVGTPTNSAIETLDEFGHVRVLEYDTFADFFWSRPRKLISSDFDGFHVLISTENDMSNPVAILETSRTNFNGRVKGLNPDTNYYVQGFFYKNRAGDIHLFGGGNKKQFRTSNAIKRNVGSSGTRQERKQARNIAKVENKVMVSVTVGDTALASTNSTSSSSNTSTSSSNATSSSSAITSTTYSSTTQNSALPYSAVSIEKLNSEKDIKARINNLKKEIEKMENELSAWQKKLRELKSPSRGNLSRRSTPRKASSVRDRTSKKKNYVSGFRYGGSASSFKKARGYRGQITKN